VSAELVRLIEAEGRALSQRVLEEMYRDSFWTHRYGDPGRRHADEDSDFHLRYLVRALQAGDGAAMTRYAVWLREVLATRGMCTRHLDENFRLLSDAIAARPWPERDRAVALLGQARAALAYEQPDARAVQQRGDRLADAIARGHRARGAGWKRDARGDGALRDDAANYVSYVADALAFGKPDTLVAHTRWFTEHVQSQGGSAADMEAFLASAREALSAEGSARAVAFMQDAAALA
jgi:hypothetical protein